MKSRKIYAMLVLGTILSGCGTAQRNTNPTNANTTTQNVPTQNQTTQPQTGQELTEDQAIQIALDRAKATREQCTAFRTKSDFENGVATYEIEFVVNGTEYTYEISKADGSIIKEQSEVQNQMQPNTNTVPTPQQGTTPPQQGATTSITLDQAAQLVLDKVPGATRNELNIHPDYEDGMQTYEGELYRQGMEYEFEINAANGNFIKWKEEVWD